jgi:ABC-type polysaccharide/polyol phosphate export permease
MQKRRKELFRISTGKKKTVSASQLSKRCKNVILNNAQCLRGGTIYTNYASSNCLFSVMCSRLPSSHDWHWIIFIYMYIHCLIFSFLLLAVLGIELKDLKHTLSPFGFSDFSVGSCAFHHTPDLHLLSSWDYR